MAGINYPLWVELKTNIVSQLNAVAIEENAVSSARNFIVSKDRWRPWIESQQSVALVNVMITGVGLVPERSNRVSSLDTVSIVVDMYALGTAGEILPADELAADRLDLLTAQVREALTRLKTTDFGFPVGMIDRNTDFSLTYYSQENEDSTGQYAPARWSFDVMLPYIPTDNNDYTDLTELNVSVKDDTLELYSLKFNYPQED